MKHLAIGMSLIMIIATSAFAAPRGGKRPATTTVVAQQAACQTQAPRHQAPRPPQSQPAQVRPAHHGVQTCPSPQQQQPQRQYQQQPPRDDHRRHDGRRPITLGSVLRGLGRALTAPCQQYPTYQSSPYTGGYGYTATYNVPCVVENQGNYVVVNRAYPVGTQLMVLGNWVTDPNTQQPLYRRDQGTLVVSQSNGITSLCTVARGGAGRGDEITIAQPVMDPVATGY